MTAVLEAIMHPSSPWGVLVVQPGWHGLSTRDILLGTCPIESMLPPAPAPLFAHAAATPPPVSRAGAITGAGTAVPEESVVHVTGLPLPEIDLASLSLVQPLNGTLLSGYCPLCLPTYLPTYLPAYLPSPHPSPLTSYV